MTALAKVFYRMKPLEPPDSFHLDAAEGWIGLSDYATANDELEQIAEANCVHPDVLRVRWRIYAHAGKWGTCLGIAAALTTLTPECPFGWIYHACTLHQLGWTQEAKDLLLFSLNAFGSNAAFPYHLARYCCGLANFTWTHFSQGLPEAGGKWSDKFTPYVWLGDEERGLAWCAESDRGWLLREPKRALEVQTAGSVVVLRIYVLDHEQTLSAPLTLLFGLQASPVKPVSFAWRAKARLLHGVN